MDEIGGLKILIDVVNLLLKEKKISCVELTNRFLKAISGLNDKLNAYVYVNSDYALEHAKKIDKKIAAKEEISILDGIPMTLKDNISTLGLETSCCSKILKGYVPIYDSFVWERLKNSGCVLLGKTNMDEFAMGSTCENSCFGGAKNPHNHSYVSGGSSGGVASAVGGGLAVFGIGSDTGGSVRQPASFCGLVGLKPTYGTVSRFGLIAFASSLDQIGPIALSAKDAAIVFDNIAFKDGKDSTCVGKIGETVPFLEDSVSGLKIGIAKQFFECVDLEIKTSVMEALKIYEKMGVEIVELSLPCVEYALSAYYIIACAEASSNLGRYDGIRYGFRASGYGSLHEMICKTRSEGFGEEVKRRILLGTYVLSSGYYDAYYKKAQLLRGRIIEEFEKAFEVCDVLFSPTSPTTAFKTGFKENNLIKTYQADVCTVPVNIAGLPAVSLPCGFDGAGLPIGMQLIGPKFSEARLLCLANWFEKETSRCFYKKIEGGVGF